MNHSIKARYRWRLLSVAACTLSSVLAAWVSLAQQPQPVRQPDTTALKNAAQSKEWLTYGGNYAETRYSPLRQIDASNVDRLGLAWTYVVGAGGGNQEATPLFSNGVLYGITNWSIAFAVDARTGQELWRFDPEVDRAFAAGATNGGVCCGILNRGLALYEGKVIIPVLDRRLIALDATTGKPQWSTRILPEDATGYSLTMAPRVVKDKVIVGLAGAEFTPHRGFFAAFDVNTGREAWRFYTVPGDPSKPFENSALEKAAKTWSGDWWKYGGGGSVWDSLSYDPDANLIYVGTGNGAPWPGSLRQSRGMDNLYVCSILAVNPDNGNLAWHYQAVPGDSWDYDSVQQLILADIEINGRARKVLMQANKGGFFYVLDRITGEFISATPFAPVNWASGHDPETGRPRIPPEAYYSTTTSATISPAAGGAANWAAKAYSPQTGLVYMPVSGFSSRTYVAVDFELNPSRALQVNGTPRGGAVPAGTPTPANPPLIGPPQSVRGGFLVAFDPVTQKERWRNPGGGGSGGGAVATASNLVFQVINDGRLLAYAAEDGRKLLEIPTGQGGMGPPITYELDGKQYISFMGGTGQAGRGRGGAASPPRLYTFVLDGKDRLP
jgi:quinohemoprotein ethanol dehydrogenase